ncbi:MAG: hypothetical protein HOW73_27855 [Polyangiaceae bacterium]|nr:hypothetical protein [Polyangiaceae bacterium]
MKTIAYVSLLAFGGGLAIYGVGCGCTEVGCSSGTSTTLATEIVTNTDLEGATVEACVNDSCTTGTLTTSGSDLFCESQGSGVPFLECSTRVTAAGIEIDVSLLIADDDAEDGDVYSFRVLSPADPEEVVAEKSGEVEYQVNEPNGSFCGPTCKNATL